MKPEGYIKLIHTPEGYIEAYVDGKLTDRKKYNLKSRQEYEITLFDGIKVYYKGKIILPEKDYKCPI